MKPLKVTINFGPNHVSLLNWIVYCYGYYIRTKRKRHKCKCKSVVNACHQLSGIEPTSGFPLWSGPQEFPVRDVIIEVVMDLWTIFTIKSPGRGLDDNLWEDFPTTSHWGSIQIGREVYWNCELFPILGDVIGSETTSLYSVWGLPPERFLLPNGPKIYCRRSRDTCFN